MTSLNLGPITRILVQHEDDRRTGLTMATSDVRAMVDEIVRLSRAVLQARECAHFAGLALLDHDLPKVRRFLDAIAEGRQVDPGPRSPVHGRDASSPE